MKELAQTNFYVTAENLISKRPADFLRASSSFSTRTSQVKVKQGRCLSRELYHVFLYLQGRLAEIVPTLWVYQSLPYREFRSKLNASFVNRKEICCQLDSSPHKFTRLVTIMAEGNLFIVLWWWKKVRTNGSFCLCMFNDSLLVSCSVKCITRHSLRVVMLSSFPGTGKKRQPWRGKKVIIKRPVVIIPMTESQFTIGWPNVCFDYKKIE